MRLTIMLFLLRFCFSASMSISSNTLIGSRTLIWIVSSFFLVFAIFKDYTMGEKKSIICDYLWLTNKIKCDINNHN